MASKKEEDRLDRIEQQLELMRMLIDLRGEEIKDLRKYCERANNEQDARNEQKFQNVKEEARIANTEQNLINEQQQFQNVREESRRANSEQMRIEQQFNNMREEARRANTCLLYTSDAADE